MVELPPRKIVVWLLGVPFVFCFIAGQMGGIAGAVVFALLVALLLFPGYLTFATGAPRRQAAWTLLPILGGLAGFGAGTAVPTLLRHPGISG